MVRLVMPLVTTDIRVVIENIDCRDGLKTLRGSSTHLIATDPPYFLHGMDDTWDAEKLRARARSAGSRTSSVGGLLPGQRFDRRQGPELYEFLLPISREHYRVLVPGGFLISFAMPRLYDCMAMAAREAGFEIRGMAFWEHGSGQGKAASVNRSVERLNISREEKDARLKKIDGRKTPQIRPTSEPFVVAQKPCEGTYEANYWRWGTGLIRVERADGKQQTMTFFHRKPKWRFNHMTTKPVGLMADLVRTFSPEGGVVLDCFMGTGTTGVAAIQLGRRFIGFERDPQHFRTAVWRLASEQLFHAYRNGLVFDSLPCIEELSPERSAD